MAEEKPSYFTEWKKGWKVFLMMFCINISGFILFFPIALITIFLLDAEILYYPLSILSFLLFGPLLMYRIMKLFYKEIS